MSLPAEFLKPDQLQNGDSQLFQSPTADEYEQFVIASFAVSGASRSLQGLVYDHYRLLHPEWELTDEQDSYAAERIQARALQITSGRGHSTQGSYMVSVELRKQSQERLKRFRNPEYTAINSEELYQEIARELILIDFHYLCLVSGRPGKPTQNDPYNPYHDPWLSYVSYFALEKEETGELAHSTRFNEINSLYEAVGRVIERGDDLGYAGLREVAYRFPDDYPLQNIRQGVSRVGVPVERNFVRMSDLLTAAKRIHDQRPL